MSLSIVNSNNHKHSVMNLYSGESDPCSHRIRIVLAEKGVAVDILNAKRGAILEDLAELNPYHSVPTLVDRGLVLYQPDIIAEYLDERFPHPPLLPVYPVARAKSRLMLHRIDKDWYSLMHKIENSREPVAKKARKELAASITSVAQAFSKNEYFFSEEFSLMDCYIAPLLWRLPHLEIELPPKVTRAINRYTKRIFNRSSFQASLTDAERDLREEIFI